MSFRLTYSSMYDPPEELHERFEQALSTARASLGARHSLFIDGRDSAGAFGGWKGSGSSGKGIASFYYLALYQREQSRTVVE